MNLSDSHSVIKNTMYKRKFNSEEGQRHKSVKLNDDAKKHSLDSDEEDETDDTNVLDEEDIEGEEEGVSGHDDGIPLTAFNMREEMEEGHFDKQGHFIWRNEKEIHDNWLDNINWQQIKPRNTVKNKDNIHGLADESDSDQEEDFDEIDTYKQLLTYMKPNETVNKTLRRLGGDIHKLSSVERLKRKKAGTLNINKDVENVTELANKILTKKGNMDVYQETYKEILEKIKHCENKTKGVNSADAALDMYSDDFGMNEKKKLEKAGPSKPIGESNCSTNIKENILMWEFKWSLDAEEVQGPFCTEQMHKWSTDGYFKTGVWIRKYGEKTNFYTSNRIDFDLYL